MSMKENLLRRNLEQAIHCLQEAMSVYLHDIQSSYTDERRSMCRDQMYEDVAQAKLLLGVILPAIQKL